MELKIEKVIKKKDDILKLSGKLLNVKAGQTKKA